MCRVLAGLDKDFTFCILVIKEYSKRCSGVNWTDQVVLYLFSTRCVSVRLSWFYFVSATPLKPLNRKYLNVVVDEDILCTGSSDLIFF